jgi:hypothetical protein
MTKSSTDLIDRYLQAVGFWLPRAQKQDILAELSEDLRSQLEDRESQLGRALAESEVADILKRRGRPIFVAGQFLPQRSLIGPALYPIYIFVLKIVSLCYVVPWLLVWVGILIFHRTQTGAQFAGEMQSLGTLWTIVFTQFGVITLIFAAIERFSASSPCLTDWDPRKLPKLKIETTTKRRYSAICGIVFGILGLLWLLIIPDFPFLIIGPAAYLLKAAPVLHTVYWPIVLFAFVSIFEHVVRLLRPDLAWFPPAFKLAITAPSLWIVAVLLHTPVYVLPINQQLAQVAGIVNLSIQISVAIWGLCLIIGLFVYAWQLTKKLRRAGHPAAPHPA